MAQITMENTPDYGANIGQNVARQSEVSREISRLEMCTQELKKLSEELIQRLSSVISPRPDNPNKETEDLKPTTPLAENLHVIGNKTLSVEKNLRFIMEGLEL